MQKITPFLWFEDQAEEAARFYTSVFGNSRLGRISHYGSVGEEVHGRPAGSVMAVEFELDGQQFIALNGGPHVRFNEAISFVVNCETQAEIDRLWDKLTAGGAAVQCGWLRDKYGVTWQIVPTVLGKLMSDPDSNKSNRVTRALLQMQKLDIAELQRAYDQQ